MISTFASDIAAAIHPAILEAIVRTSDGFAFPYGEDDITRKAEDALLREFDLAEGCVLFTATGTGANILGLDLLMAHHQVGPIICADCAHIRVDECGGPERILGTRLIGIPSKNGRISVQAVRESRESVPPFLRAEPAVLSVTQPSELGTVYTIEELRAFRALCDERGWFFHIDGARLPNAAHRLNVELADLTTRVGVDIFTFGGTKSGLAFGEAVIVVNPELAERAHYARRQLTQLVPKMRFVATQFRALLDNDLWLRNAAHANALAALLADRVRDAGVDIAFPVETNMVYVTLPEPALSAFRNDFAVYPLEPNSATQRLVTSWQTSEADVAGLATHLAQVMPSQGSYP